MRTRSESLFLTTQDAVRRTGQSFPQPDSDWAPVLFALGREGLAISPLFGNADTSEVTSLVTGFLRHIGATEAAIVQSTWALRPEHITAEVLKSSVAQHPDRIEALIIVHADRNRAQMATAQIHRDHATPPTLAGFTITAVPTVGPSARITAAIRTGIQ
jgi:hypothetical protein